MPKKSFESKIKMIFLRNLAKRDFFAKVDFFDRIPQRFLIKKSFFLISVFFQKLILIYQRYLSPFFPNTCRYSPTCSEYALQALKFNNPFLAIFQIFWRLLRCNQFFKGGIDYPIGYGVLKGKYSTPQKILFWLIPLRKKGFLKAKFYIIRSL